MRDINALPMPANYRWLGGKIADNFAGGGGASTGIAQGIGFSPDIAVNHNAEALMMHEQNHPSTKHYNESVWDINIPQALDGQPALMGWFSPDCTHFSVAKGGKPVKKAIRGLAWIVKKWVGQSDMAMVFMENVKEFMTWGPLIAKRCKATKRVIKLVADPVKKDKNGDPVMNEVVSEPGEYVPYWEQALVPDKKRAGQTFKQFVKQLRAEGYTVEWKEKGLNACDYGDPTTRNRFFLMARKDGLPIIWPEPTHADKKFMKANPGKLQPWKTAGDNLDFSLACPSIFDRKKPLAEKTLARIFKGIEKFVIGAGDDAFLVKTNHGGSDFRGQSINDPIATLTSKHGTGLAAVSLSKFNQNSIGQDIDLPLDTVMAGATRFAMVEAQLQSAAAVMKFRGDSGGSSCHMPLPCITAGGGAARPAGAPHALGVLETKLELVQAGCIATIDHQSTGDTSKAWDEPLSVVTSKARHIQVAALLKHYTGVVGQKLDLPLPTITATDHNAVMQCTLESMDPAQDLDDAIEVASLVKLRGSCNHGQALDRPLDTISAQGNHYAEVRSTLSPVDYHNSPLEKGENDGCDGSLQGTCGSERVRGSAGRNDLETGGQDQLGEAQTEGTEAHGQAGEQRLPGGELLVSGQALHGQCSSSGLRGAGGADTSGAGHQPREGQQTHQRSGIPGANDQGRESPACVPNRAEEASHSPDTGRHPQGSESIESPGHDLSGDRPEHGCVSDNRVQSRQLQVTNFLVKYFGTGTAVSLDEPLDTITSKARFGLVTIKGQDYQIVDIGMRMLEPHELYRCQGFPADYQHEVVMGKKLPKHAQVRMVGNSVPPGLARALVSANIPRWALQRELAGAA